MNPDAPTPPHRPGPGQLRRATGLPGALVIGLGSILGTGVFVSLAPMGSRRPSWRR